MDGNGSARCVGSATVLNADALRGKQVCLPKSKPSVGTYFRQAKLPIYPPPIVTHSGEIDPTSNHPASFAGLAGAVGFSTVIHGRFAQVAV
jgi:hypothetical protein